MLALAFLIGFGVLGGIGALLVASALANLRDPGADSALNTGLILVGIGMIGAAVVLF